MWPKSIFGLVLVSMATASDRSSPSTDGATKEVILNILSKIEEAQARHSHVQRKRPFVTVSFAQSLDGKIGTMNKASSVSSNLPLSGKESLYLTHAIRSCHDAILIGGTTALVDNPRLTQRLWSGSQQQPRPIILDTNLKSLVGSRSSRRVCNPIVCCSFDAKAQNAQVEDDVVLCACNVDAAGRLDLHDVLNRLYTDYGITSIMVEGGSSILSSFSMHQVVDYVCITIAPKLIGARGLSCISSNLASLVDLTTQGSFFSLGNDCIFAAPWESPTSASK